jgi:hypothetical protein
LNDYGSYFSGLVLRMIAGTKIAWEEIKNEPQDPFNGEFRGEISHDWLEEWYKAHEVSAKLSAAYFSQILKEDPYPTTDEKERLGTMTGLTMKQVEKKHKKNFF